MKKLIYAIASLALILTGCTKEINEVGAGDGETVKVSVSTMLENAQPATKADWDNDGYAALVDHWIMEVYDAQGTLFDRQEKDGQSGLTNTFDVVLIKNQSYKFAFWADTKGMYNTDDLRAVKTVSRKAGRDGRDAFFCEKDYKSTKSETLEAKLYRPFHQINIVTTDLDKVYKQMEKAGTTGDYAKFIPTALKLKGETYNEFNVLTGEVSDVQEYELNIASCYADYMAHAAKTTIFMDYGFATTEKELKDLDFVFTSNGEEIAYNFTNIPLQRNYRTNILGNFLSNDATWNVEIIPIWDGDGTTDEEGDDPYLVNYVEAGSIEAANQALAEGETNISIEDPEDAATHVVFPEEVTGKDVTINLTGAAGKTIYFENATVTKASGTTDGPANLTIIADEQSLNVNCPKTNVLINKGEGETDFPVIVAKSLKVEGEEGAVLKTPLATVTLACESEIRNLEIATNSANNVNYGAVYATKSSTFENVKFTGKPTNCLVLGGNGTTMNVKDCVFANGGRSRSIKVWGGTPVINVENSTFDSLYPFNVDGGSPVFNVEGSTLNGWTSYGGNTTASFKNCSFGKSTSGYAYCRPYLNTTFTECDFSSDFRIDFGAKDIVITLIDCTVGGTSAVTKNILDLGELSNQGVLIINGATAYPAYTTDVDGNFHVATKDGLFTIAEDMNASLDAFYHKTIFIDADIDLEETAWTPIQGSQSGDYTITFNAQNHKISNVSVSDVAEDGGAGFFGHWAGTITNLVLEDVTIANTVNWSGALCGYFSTGTISNVVVDGVTISNLNETKCKRNGGLCGFVNASTVFNNVAVKDVNIIGTEQLGGFIGSLQADGDATYNFSDCSVEGVEIAKVGTKEVVSFGSKVGGRAAGAAISGDIVVSGTVTLPEGSAEDGWGVVGL